MTRKLVPNIPGIRGMSVEGVFMTRDRPGSYLGGSTLVGRSGWFLNGQDDQWNDKHLAAKGLLRYPTRAELAKRVSSLIARELQAKKEAALSPRQIRKKKRQSVLAARQHERSAARKPKRRKPKSLALLWAQELWPADVDIKLPEHLVALLAERESR